MGKVSITALSIGFSFSHKPNEDGTQWRYVEAHHHDKVAEAQEY